MEVMSRTSQALARRRFSWLACPPSAAACRALMPMRRSSIGKESLAVGRVSGFDNEVKDQPASAGGQIELVAIIDVAAAPDDDVGMRLEQADPAPPCRP